MRAGFSGAAHPLGFLQGDVFLLSQGSDHSSPLFSYPLSLSPLLGCLVLLPCCLDDVFISQVAAEIDLILLVIPIKSLGVLGRD